MKITSRQITPSEQVAQTSAPSSLARLFPCFSQGTQSSRPRRYTRENSWNFFSQERKKRAWASVEAGNAILDNIGEYRLREQDRFEIFCFVLSRAGKDLNLLSKVRNFDLSVNSRVTLASRFMPEPSTAINFDKLKRLLEALAYLDLEKELDAYLVFLFLNSQYETSILEYQKKLYLFAEHFAPLHVSGEGRCAFARQFLDQSHDTRFDWDVRVHLFLGQLDLYELNATQLIQCLQVIAAGPTKRLDENGMAPPIIKAMDKPYGRCHIDSLYQYALKLEQKEKGSLPKIVLAAQAVWPLFTLRNMEERAK